MVTWTLSANLCVSGAFLGKDSGGAGMYGRGRTDCDQSVVERGCRGCEERTDRDMRTVGSQFYTRSLTTAGGRACIRTTIKISMRPTCRAEASVFGLLHLGSSLYLISDDASLILLIN